MRTTGLAHAGIIAGTALCVATSASATDLVYGSWVSPKHSIMTSGAVPYIADIKKQTNGAINWKLVAGGQLVDAKGTAAGLKDSLIDGGFLVPPYAASYVPSINLVFTTQVFGDDAVGATGAQIEYMMLKCPSCLEEAKKNNLVNLSGYSTTPFVLMCRIPIKSSAELKGKKVRAIGGAVKLMQLAGATPVVMSPADATQALQRGGIDCVNGPVSWLRSYGYQDVAKHVVDFPLGMAGPALHIVINRKKFLEMTPEQRKIHVMAAAASTASATIDGYILNDRKIIADAKKRGVSFVKGDKGFEQIVAKRLADQDQETQKQAEKFNLKNGAQLIKDFNQLLEKWRKLSKGIGLDKAKFTEALTREVYGKVDPEKL